MTFDVGQGSYGIPILKVQEIIEIMQLTAVSRTPEFVKGVIILRGRIVPVIEMRRFFGLEEAPDSERRCIVVSVELDGEEAKTGLLVDQVVEVLDVPA